jgi:predicted  nucleic acid-binding Zn-ribbon protein
MKADPRAQLRLLEVQAADSALDRLAVRRRNLPELAEIDKISDQLSALDDGFVGVTTEIRDLGRAQRKLEDEIEMVRGRAARDRSRLDSGQIANARELENLSSEIASLARRQSALEDDQLEIMEQVEGKESDAARLDADRTRLRAELDVLTSQRDAAFVEIDTDATMLRDSRGGLLPDVPPDLLTLYQKLRTSNGGVGAARLVRRRCEGCHLELSGADLREVAAAPLDEVVRCEECRRILVRTEESGL